MGDNIHQHSVQCALPINLFNEKFFIYLWFWLIILLTVTLINFLNWFKIVIPSYRKRVVSKYLRTHRKLGSGEKDKEMFNSFVMDYCHLDGAFIFEIIRRNSNYITTSEIIVSLWQKYYREYTRNALENENKQMIKGSYDKDAVEIGMIDDEPEKSPFSP